MHQNNSWIVVLLGFLVCLSALEAGDEAVQRRSETIAAPVTVTVLYDNYRYKTGTTTDWGFSCLIEGTEKTILFDTGTSPQILAANVDALKAAVNKAAMIVLSHEHGDHTGGLQWALQKTDHPQVFFPVSFPPELVERVKRGGGIPVPVNAAVRLCRGVWSTGEMGAGIREHSLVINTKKGLVIVTGCSHPGILNIIRRARELFDFAPVKLVFGGFHLARLSPGEARETAREMQALKVQSCGASHCTGEHVINAMAEVFGKDFVKIGTGRVLAIDP